MPPEFGYQHGLRQACTSLSLGFKLPGQADLLRIDAWLTGPFELDSIGPVGEIPGTGKPADIRLAAELAWRALHFSAALLRWLRVPMLEPGRVLAVKCDSPDAGSVVVSVARPVVDLLEGPAIRAAHETAINAVLAMARHPLTDATRNAMFKRMESGFFARYPYPPGTGKSTMAMLQAAFSEGIPIRHLGNSVYQLGYGMHAMNVTRSTCDADSSIGATIAQDKRWTGTLLRNHGLPAPVHLAVSRPKQAIAAARQLGWPVVVKPVDRDRGEGITTHIQDEAGLLAAHAHASALSQTVLVERHVAGTCHRIVVADAKVLAVFKRWPKAVRGDGRQTVRALVAQANAHEQSRAPWLRLKPFQLDDTALACLSAAGLGADDIVPAGKLAPLRPFETTEWGGVVDDLTEGIHPDNVDVAIRATQAFGLALAGVDMISPDITRPWHENGAIINEINYSPFIGGLPRSQQALRTFLAARLPHQGRIPLIAAVGAQGAWDLARAMHDTLLQRGLAAQLTSHDMTLDAQLRPRVLAADGLMARARALLCDRSTQALILVIQNAQLLETGLPVDRLDAYEVSADAETSGSAWLQPMRAALESALIGPLHTQDAASAM